LFRNKFDTAGEWLDIYGKAGLKTNGYVTGPFRMLSVTGFLSDEGLINTLTIMARAMSRVAFMKKMFWLMPRMAKVPASLGYVVFAGEKAGALS